jgi:hypothetical protein
MLNKKEQFLVEFKELLKKYDVIISAGVGSGSDTYGIYDESITISHRVDSKKFKYEDWLTVDGWSIDEKDIL